MKLLRKTNIGLILAVMAIIVVTVYCIRLDASRKNSKEDIKKACEEFINITDKYCILPEQYQVIGENGNSIDLKDYFSEMKEELQKVTTTEETANIQKSILSENVENQLLNTSVITTNFDRKITKISSYQFDGNQVTVTFKSKISTKQKYQELNKENGEMVERVKDGAFEANTESIILEQKDGIWKVVSANLMYNQNSNIMGLPYNF